jgi:putative molybdopterin biosynthesis protein
MSIYLHDIPLPDAKEHLKAALESAGLWCVLGEEIIQLYENAYGRVLSQAIWAKVSSPNYNASAMDGFAVHAENTSGGSPSKPIILAVDSFAKYVDTGDPLPEDCNAVIPIENVESLDKDGMSAKDIRRPEKIRIRAAVTPWTHVRFLGEDIVASQLVLPAGQVLRPEDLGAIAASGHTKIKVSRKPRIAIIPTGTELVPLGGEIKPGNIFEYNSIVMAAQIKIWGGEVTRFPITPDDINLISRQVLKAASNHDLILLNAGSSAGEEDFSAKVVEKLGRLIVHGVAIKPGHPVIIGMIICDTRQVPIIGVPGYPISSELVCKIFVEPLIAKWLGCRPSELPRKHAQLTRKIVSPSGDDEFIQVTVGMVGEKILATPLSRGAGIISTLVRADGFIILSRGIQGVEAGQDVIVHSYRSQADLEFTILAIGSHDITLDLLAQFLSDRNRRLTSANVGSLGGLLALRRGEAHFAGSHLLDPNSGEYNIPYIHKYLPDVPVWVVGFVGREQGLLIEKKNPKGIAGLNDLIRPDIIYVNRQKGAGTRILFDYHLALMGIVPQSITGYKDEEYTHLGVAAAIASGRADCGLGIAAAAQALDLDFIPLFKERYDLIVPKVHAQSELLAPLFDLLRNINFQREVASLPGYDVEPMGNIIVEV